VGYVIRRMGGRDWIMGFASLNECDDKKTARYTSLDHELHDTPGRIHSSGL